MNTDDIEAIEELQTAIQDDDPGRPSPRDCMACDDWRLELASFRELILNQAAQIAELQMQDYRSRLRSRSRDDYDG